MPTPQQAGWNDDSQDPVGSPPKRRRGQTIALSAAAVFVVAVSAVATQPPTAGAATSKTVVDGQDITGKSQGDPQCVAEQGSEGPEYTINAFPSTTIKLSSDQTQILDIELAQADLGKFWSWSPGAPGNAQLTQSGNTYTVTGNIQPIVAQIPGAPVPFEAEVTCP
jgi:hypothetical protein